MMAHESTKRLVSVFKAEDTAMDRLEEVWNLDPSDRMRLQLFADDSLDDQSEA